jgi:hypothetical protein
MACGFSDRGGGVVGWNACGGGFGCSTDFEAEAD